MLILCSGSTYCLVLCLLRTKSLVVKRLTWRLAGNLTYLCLFGISSPEVKWPGLEIGHIHLATRYRIKWKCTSTPPYAFSPCILTTLIAQWNISWRVKAAGVQGWQPYHLHVPIVLKSGSLKLLEPSGPVQTCNGFASPFFSSRAACGFGVVQLRIFCQ
jgi:hypothetical protein